MTSRRPLASALDKVFPHLLILLYSLGAAVIYDHHWPFALHGRLSCAFHGIYSCAF